MQPTIIAMPRQFVGKTQPRRRARIFSSPAAAISEAVLLVMLIGWFDYHTGDVAMTLFYFGPVVLATWCSGRAAGWSIAFFSGATWLTSDLLLHADNYAVATPYLNGGMLVLVCGTVVELVLSSRRAHDRLRTRLELRTVSLAEVHHRVKNNLQVVSSLLLLQSEKFADPTVRNVFKECRDRINAMARLHEQLYVDAEASQIDFAPHLRELAEMLVQSHTPPGCRLALDIRADQVPLDLDRGILLSLIATELLLNALKHAFQGCAQGKLQVTLFWSARRVLLSVRDNGIGLGAQLAADAEERSSGIELVRAMTRQLNGELMIGNDPISGTCASISFPTKVSREHRFATAAAMHYVEPSNINRRRRSADGLCA